MLDASELWPPALNLHQHNKSTTWWFYVDIKISCFTVNPALATLSCELNCSRGLRMSVKLFF